MVINWHNLFKITFTFLAKGKAILFKRAIFSLFLDTLYLSSYLSALQQKKRENE